MLLLTCIKRSKIINQMLKYTMQPNNLEKYNTSGMIQAIVVKCNLIKIRSILISLLMAYLINYAA